jgi:DNA primase
MIREGTIYPESCLIRLLPDYRYWNGRGISTETLKRFKGGVGQVEEFKAFYTIPIYNEERKIVGFTGRYILDYLKYKKPKFRHTAHKSTWAFPLHLNKEIILQKREIILVEGIGDILSLFECQIENVLSLWGVQLSPSVFNSIVRLNPKRIIIATNKDEAHTVGQEASLKIKAKLDKFFDPSNIIIHHPTLKDLNDMLMQQGKEGVIKWYDSVK